MPHVHLAYPLTPKDGRTLRVLGVCRISTVHQDERSLEAQEELIRRWVGDRHDGPVEFKFIKSRGSGEVVDREEALEIEAEAASGRYDLVPAEDLGRIYRRLHAMIFCENCLDHRTRVVAIIDNLDTADPNWRLQGMFAVMRHEAYNADTAAKIRRQLRSNFMRGGVLQTFQYGYVKPEGATHVDQVSKDPAAGPNYERWAVILESGGTYAEVRDFLVSARVAPRPGADPEDWTPRMVARMTHNPILKGVRVRNRRRSERVNKTGRHRQVKAPPEDLLEYPVPHLAFFEVARYDRMIRSLAERNGRYRRRKGNDPDPCAGRPRKRTPWPGQSLYCGVCGRKFVYGGHGQAERLMCVGAREHACWNGATCSGPDAARRVVEAIWVRVVGLPGFEAAFREITAERFRAGAGDLERRGEELRRRQERIQKEERNLQAAIAAAGAEPFLMEGVARLRDEREELRLELDAWDECRRREPAVPTFGEFMGLAGSALRDVDVASQEFFRAVRRLVERPHVFPVQPLDGGDVELRMRFTLRLARLIPGAEHWCPDGLMRYELEVDLFDPPQRIEHRGRVTELTAEGLTERAIAAELGLTQPAVQHAKRFARLMERLGATDPYRRLTGPPEKNKLRRHLHERYRFDPLPGYPLTE